MFNRIVTFINDYFWGIVKGVLIASCVGLFIDLLVNMGAISTLVAPKTNEAILKIFDAIDKYLFITSGLSLLSYFIRWAVRKFKELWEDIF
jgi:uncharacterized membrane protein